MTTALMVGYLLALVSMIVLPFFRGLAGFAEGMLLFLTVDSFIVFSMTPRENSGPSLTTIAVCIGSIGLIEAVFSSARKISVSQNRTTELLEARVKKTKPEGE